MTATLSVRSAAWQRLAQLRELLDLVNDVRALDDPFAAPESFRRLITLVVRLGSAVGFDSVALERFEQLLTDDNLVAAVLAITHYVLRSTGFRTVGLQATSNFAPLVVDAQSYAEWLPLVIELVQLVRKLRGAA
ncbi:MAG: hypothetical protein C0483_20455 [Pirellula sp.]|nr:hypothetical protein [Pirellula sp.]